MRKIDPTIMGLIFLSAIIFGGVFLVGSSLQEQGIPQYKSDNENRPRLEIKENAFDLGKMKLAEIKTREIEIKNTGREPLVISDLVTSCDCTFAQLVVEGKEGPRFSMRRNSRWQSKISASSSATLKIIYEPRLMPVQGKVKREVVFRSNDPEQPLTNVRFTAEVE